MNNSQWCGKGTSERARQHRNINEHVIAGVMRRRGFPPSVAFHELTDCERAVIRRIVRWFRDPKNWKVSTVSDPLSYQYVE